MISFIPPDGDFELISYRLDVKVKPLFSVDVIIERKSTTKIEFLIKAKSNFKSKSTANNVEVGGSCMIDGGIDLCACAGRCGIAGV